MKIPIRGPGRPRKWNKPLRQWRADIPEDDYDYIEETRAKLGLSRAEFIHFILHQSNINVLELQAENKHLKEYVEQLEKEKQALLEEIEKLREEIERLKLKLEAYEKGRAAVSSRYSRIINALVKVIEEGKSWADTMVEIGVELPQEQLAILKDLFITRDERGETARVLKPVKGLRKLKGWVLVKGKDSSLLNYVWAREDDVKAARDVQVVSKPKRVRVEEDRVVHVESVYGEIEKHFRAWLKTYRMLKGERAEEHLRMVAEHGLRKLIREYGLEAVLQVVESNYEYKRVFGPFLPQSRAPIKEVMANE